MSNTATVTATPRTIVHTKPEVPGRVNLTHNEEAIQAIIAFREAKDALKAAEDAKKAAEATIRAALGGATLGVVNGAPVVKISSERTRTSYDASILVSAFPEAEQAARRSSTYNFVQTL